MTKKLLGLDVGDKRIGLAVSDDLGLMAHGLSTLNRTNIKKDLTALRKIIEEYVYDYSGTRVMKKSHTQDGIITTYYPKSSLLILIQRSQFSFYRFEIVYFNFFYNPTPESNHDQC